MSIHCVKSVRIQGYSAWMQKNVDHINSEYEHFLRSGFDSDKDKILENILKLFQNFRFKVVMARCIFCFKV